MDWKRKLTSRKFWLAITGFVTGLMLYLGKSAEESEKVVTLVMAGASVIAYIIGEGLTDAASVAHSDTNADSVDNSLDK